MTVTYGGLFFVLICKFIMEVHRLAKKKKVNDYGTGIPQHEMEALARVLLPEIEKFYASEEGQRQFAQCQQEKPAEKKPPRKHEMER